VGETIRQDTPAGAEPLTARRIFVVDDEAVIATTLAQVFQVNGFDAIPFTHPLLALIAARTHEPHLLISDVEMPGLSGVALAIRVKEECTRCRVLLFSGEPNSIGLIQNAREQGHEFLFLEKPVPPAKLVALAQKLTQDHGEVEGR
jgi:DNA-binding NtrC family response regulator